MIDYDGFRAYLTKIGFIDNGINTYITSYLHENKLDILRKLDDYKTLVDEEKIIKFASAKNNIKDEFNRYHNYAKKTTFSDMRSGARRYKLYLQYKNIIGTMQRYDDNPSKFDSNDAYMYFKVFDSDSIYPIKAICREKLTILELNKNDCLLLLLYSLLFYYYK